MKRIPHIRPRGWLIVATAAIALAGGTVLAQARKVPYFASISASKARMRTGPGREYPASWLYIRADLPVKVIGIFKEWRRVEDPDGTQGWMLANLLSGNRTGMVMGQVLEMRSEPRLTAPVSWRAAPGVIGRLSKCKQGWCWFDVHGQSGYVEASHLWGIAPDETIS
jgi:SH3-like domain-containing protein